MALLTPKILTEKDHRTKAENGFSIDLKSNKFYHYTEEIFLSEKLHHLIKYFMQNKGNCVSYEEISHILFEETQNINTLRSTIHRLKVKLPHLDLHSVSKRGYVLY